MNRVLLSLVIAEAVIIVLLAFQLLGQDDRAQHSGQQSSVASEDAGPRSSTSTEPAKRTESHAAPPGQSGKAADSDYVVLHGRITSSAGGPLKPPLWISLTEPGAKPDYTQVKPNGFYAFAGLRPGTYKLSVNGPAYDDVETKLDLTAAVTRWDVELTAAMVIHIRLQTPDGKPLAKALGKRKIHLGTTGGVICVATREPIQRLPLTENRGHSRYGIGSFRNAWGMRARNQKKLPEGVAGVLMVKAAPPFYVSAAFMHLVLATKKVTSPVEELTFVIDPEAVENCLATVNVRVVDAESGAPLKARVSISDRQSGGGGLMTDEEGRVTYPNVPPGVKEFQIWTQHYEAVHTFIRVADGGPIDVGTFRLHKAVAIEGRIVDSEGKPTSARLVVRNLDRMTFPQPMRHARSYQSDTEGKFKIRRVGRGRYLIAASLKDHARTCVVVDTRGGAVTNLQIKIGKGTAVTLEPEPDRSTGYFVTIRREGVPYVARSVRGNWPIKTTLAPGRYTIEIAVDGEVHKTIPLDVGKDPIVRAISQR